MAELDLVEAIAPIQLAIRLLIPAGSRLLELPVVQELVGEFDERALMYPWVHPDPAMDRLCEDVLAVVKAGQDQHESRRSIFAKVWRLAHEACGREAPELAESTEEFPRVPIPYMSEPWYC